MSAQPPEGPPWRKGPAKSATRAPQQALAGFDAEAPLGTKAIAVATAEIIAIPPVVLHREAAYRWAARAVASYRVCATKNDLQQCLSYFYLGEHYREAAVAQAKLGEQWQSLLADLEDALSAARSLAFTAMQRFNDNAVPGPGERASAPTE